MNAFLTSNSQEEPKQGSTKRCKESPTEDISRPNALVRVLEEVWTTGPRFPALRTIAPKSRPGVGVYTITQAA